MALGSSCRAAPSPFALTLPAWKQLSPCPWQRCHLGSCFHSAPQPLPVGMSPELQDLWRGSGLTAWAQRNLGSLTLPILSQLQGLSPLLPFCFLRGEKDLNIPITGKLHLEVQCLNPSSSFQRELKCHQNSEVFPFQEFLPVMTSAVPLQTMPCVLPSSRIPPCPAWH